MSVNKITIYKSSNPTNKYIQYIGKTLEIKTENRIEYGVSIGEGHFIYVLKEDCEPAQDEECYIGGPIENISSIEYLQKKYEYHQGRMDYYHELITNI